MAGARRLTSGRRVTMKSVEEALLAVLDQLPPAPLTGSRSTAR